MRVLIADNESSVVQEVPAALQREGHQVYVHPSVSELPDVVLAKGIHLVIFEPALISLTQALDLCHSIRQESAIMLLIVTRLTSVAERVKLLEAGADDASASPSTTANCWRECAPCYAAIPSASLGAVQLWYR